MFQFDESNFHVVSYVDEYGNDHENSFSVHKDYIDRFTKDFEADQIMGITSHSHHPDNQRHNLFLEWDHEVDIDSIVETIGDCIVTMTSRGFHIIQTHLLLPEDLARLQNKFGCCGGFINQGLSRGYWVLRISPKNNIPLTMIRYPEVVRSDLYDSYKRLVEEFNDYKLSNPINEAIELATQELSSARNF